VTYEDAQRKVHDAIGGLLREGEIAVGWTLTIDVAGPDDGRYLAHRAGGGIDGSSSPMVWTALGMLRAGAQVAEAQLAEGTVDHEDEEES
jgi:hypothetical protein